MRCLLLTYATPGLALVASSRAAFHGSLYEQHNTNFHKRACSTNLESMTTAQTIAHALRSDHSCPMGVGAGNSAGAGAASEPINFKPQVLMLDTSNLDTNNLVRTTAGELPVRGHAPVGRSCPMGVGAGVSAGAGAASGLTNFQPQVLIQDTCKLLVTSTAAAAAPPLVGTAAAPLSTAVVVAPVAPPLVGTTAVAPGAA